MFKMFGVVEPQGLCPLSWACQCEGESLGHWLSHLKGFCSARARATVIVLASRLHERYWIFLMPLSSSSQFSIVTAVCHESIVLRPTLWWIDLWAATSQFSSSCQGQWNRNHSQWWKLAFLYVAQHLPVVISILQGPSRFYEGRLRNTRRDTEAYFKQAHLVAREKGSGPWN